jgi:hypothetical protein
MTYVADLKDANIRPDKVIVCGNYGSLGIASLSLNENGSFEARQLKKHCIHVEDLAIELRLFGTSIISSYASFK